MLSFPRSEDDTTSYQEEEEEQMEVKYVPTPVAPFVNIEMPPSHINNNTEDNAPVSPLCPLSPSTEKKTLEISILRRQERVLQLQEEYYSLKIKHLKARLLDFWWDSEAIWNKKTFTVLKNTRNFGCRFLSS